MGTEETSPGGKESSDVSDLESKIIRQVEYYFGNYNLTKDKFLREQIKLNDGWIPLETLIKFNRLKMLSEDFAIIAEALKKSPNKLMEVNEDGTKIRRSTERPLPENSEDLRKEIDQRSVYVKGFKVDTTLDELLEFFKQYGNAENVTMRRRKPTRRFRGSVFVTFATKDDAAKFLELKDIKFHGTDLLKEPKLSYLERKSLLFEQIKKEMEKKKKKKLAQQSGKETSETEKNDDDENITKGCLLKLTELPPNTMREHIKEVFSPHGDVAFIDFKKGLTEAVVRFESPVAAEVLEKVAEEENAIKRIKILDHLVPVICLEGEDESNYWKTIAVSKLNMKQRKAFQNRGGKSFRGGKGRFGKRDRRQREKDDADTTNETPAKKRKVDSQNEKDESASNNVTDSTTNKNSLKTSKDGEMEAEDSSVDMSEN